MLLAFGQIKMFYSSNCILFNVSRATIAEQIRITKVEKRRVKSANGCCCYAYSGVFVYGEGTQIEAYKMKFVYLNFV